MNQKAEKQFDRDSSLDGEMADSRSKQIPELEDEKTFAG